MNNQLTSLTLLDRLQDDTDHSAWELFVQMYQPLMEHCLAISGVDRDDVEDLAQDCLAKLVVAIPDFKHNGRIGAFRAWLRTIVVHRALEHLRRRRNFTVVCDRWSVLAKRFEDTIQEFLDREHDQLVVSRILQLIRPEFTKTTWEAFERQVIDGKRATEVAGELGRTVNSVLLCKSRVLRRLRQLGQGLIEC
jgi:RNA polymerase sigma-70 factor (ECF subfamily)